jgi:hypothetical protein
MISLTFTTVATTLPRFDFCLSDCRPDRGTIGRSGANRDYRMSTYDRAAFPGRCADVTAWARESAHVEGLALPKSVESGNLSLAKALSDGCRPD